MTEPKWKSLSDESKQRIMQEVLSKTPDGKYGAVVETTTNLEQVKHKYNIAAECYKCVDYSDGQFTGGYWYEVWMKDPCTYYWFSFQDEDLVEYEKRIKGVAMNEQKRVKQDIEDIFLFPDGEWCYRYELHEFLWKSDDYEIIAFQSDNYMDLVNANN